MLVKDRGRRWTASSVVTAEILIIHSPYTNSWINQMAPIPAYRLEADLDFGRDFAMFDNPSLGEKHSVVASSDADGHVADARGHLSKGHLSWHIGRSVLPQNEVGM